MKPLQKKQLGCNRSVCISFLQQRGVSVEEIASLVLILQKPYLPDLTLTECIENVNCVLEKREVQNAILTGLTLDTLTEKGVVPEPLNSIIRNDDALYGIDEILSLSIVNVYGSIGFTNFGYLDKLKPGVIGKLNKDKGTTVNTFIDDLIAALAAATAARIAHRVQSESNTSE
ncbi:MAG: phosphatidylglycerophosphatase A [bacterium]|jgi:phosphatidylglycerophosphatase A